jgi:hypothetical protein
MDFNKFQINIKDLKISGSEESVSKTIEELLHLNDKLPARWENDKDISMLTNKQFDNSKHYESKEHRGEQRDPYQKQLQQRRTEKEYPVQEEQFTEKGQNGGHRPEMWDKDNQKVRGHKNVQPIWHEVYRLEDERKSEPMEKKIKK